MFERRLKIFLLVLIAIIGMLLMRAGSAQLLHRDYWKLQATEAMKRTHLVDTTRGRILDVRGKPLAVDLPCIDACVDFRAIQFPPDENWVKAQALDRLRTQLGSQYKEAGKRQQKVMREQEAQHVLRDIALMWKKLAQVSGRSEEDISSARDLISQRVMMQRKYVVLKTYENAIKKQDEKKEKSPNSWRQWLGTEPKSEKMEMEDFRITVAEQLEPHVILPAIDTETQNELGKHIDQYPGLVLRPGTHRYYPYGDVACHLLGNLSKVKREDLIKDAKGEKDELRQYLPNDEIGRIGIESLCEPTLRGTRGRFEKVVGDDRIVANLEPVPGQDVRLSIDIELQQQIQTAFSDARIRDADGKVSETTVLHGAAVVLDVNSGEVRAMVSYPTYDLNKLDEQYTALTKDELNQPLMNRATMAQLEPGSTVKPMVGLAAISEGLLKVDEGIECTGFLVLGGKRYPMGRCWVASKFSQQLGGNVAHHPVPWDAPHPTGFLVYSDGLERSCNIFFETAADRLGFDRLSEWYKRFGLGRPTGIGINEETGRVPTYYHWLPQWKKRAAGWFAGIGQGYILATPIQMGNVAATIARGGIWERPTLLAHVPEGQPTTRPGSVPDGPARVDLRIPRPAIEAAWDGMNRVVNGKAGTGKGLIKGDELLASANIDGKTGTAQAARLRLTLRGPDGEPLKDEHGKPRYEFLEPSTQAEPNLRALWYRGSGHDNKELAHAWYIGFAPADHPQVAFAVMVEYGGSGGIAAASVAREALEACIAHHYLNVTKPDLTAGAKVEQ